MLKSEVCLCQNNLKKIQEEDSEIWKRNKTNTGSFFTVLDNFFTFVVNSKV
jgi:hypothetical protein